MTDSSAVPATTARSRADAEKAIAAVLAERKKWRSFTTSKYECLCGFVVCWGSPEEVDDAHRAHVASVIAGYMADAWRLGAETVYEDWSEAEGPFLDDVEDTFPNPYRRRGTDDGSDG